MNTYKNMHFRTYIKNDNPHRSIVCYKLNILSIVFKSGWDLTWQKKKKNGKDVKVLLFFPPLQ